MWSSIARNWSACMTIGAVGNELVRLYPAACYLWAHGLGSRANLLLAHDPLG